MGTVSDDPISWLLRGIDPEKLTPEQVAEVDAIVHRGAVFRCQMMIDWLEDTMSRLADDATPEAARKRAEKRIEKLWHVYQARTDRSGTRTRRLAGILEQASRMREVAPRAAPYFFIRLLGIAEDRALHKMNAKSLAVLEECLAVWRRRAGAPTARDRRRPKWDVFAELHKALGLGEIAADDARKECSPSRRRGQKQRTSRH